MSGVRERYGWLKTELGLSFEESVYAIAFDLEGELRQKGKELVFSELPGCERMQENVQRVLNEDSIYALKTALGFPAGGTFE